jgi:hypothetical protein
MDLEFMEHAPPINTWYCMCNMYISDLMQRPILHPFMSIDLLCDIVHGMTSIVGGKCGIIIIGIWNRGDLMPL